MMFYLMLTAAVLVAIPVAIVLVLLNEFHGKDE